MDSREVTFSCFAGRYYNTKACAQMDFATQAPVWQAGYATSVVFDTPLSLKLGANPSSVGGALDYSFSHNGLRLPMDFLVGGDSCIGVDGCILRHSQIYASSKARAVRSMLLPIDWDDSVVVQVCA